ncbi:AGAP010009-PA-like protein [Anopheles sinensis]|uniref:AGAP010009-PA-like protein n=1 Tax=Anopheles sinensis TaxID=74873 RepID=A0A084VSN7_ANOSI|nr:AGAP010009-PA-like protein [Anopheles sinensis]
MDHLEQMSSSIDGHQNMSKGVLRSSMQSNDSGSLHFITSSGVGHSTREQEYIESSLLGTDLLSSQLPTNLLNDYINSVSSTASNSLGNPQSTLVEHHYRPFNSDELHSLTSDSNNDGTVLVNGTKDIPGFSTLTSYEKLMDVPQPSSPMSSSLAQMTGTMESYVHFPLPGQLHGTDPGNDGFDMIGGNLMSTHSHSHHHHHHHHPPPPPHQHNQTQPPQHTQQELQNHYGLPHVSHAHHHHQQHGQQHIVHHQSVAELSNNSQQVATIQQHSLHVDQSQASSVLPSPSVDAPIKVYNIGNSLMPVTSTVVKQTNVHSLPTMSFSTLRPNESPKRFYSCTTLPSLMVRHQRSNSDTADSLETLGNHDGSDIVPCEPRSAEEEIADCVVSLENATASNAPQCAMLGNSINLPHKKRLTKKLGDVKGDAGGNETEQSIPIPTEQPLPVRRGTVIANDSSDVHGSVVSNDVPKATGTQQRRLAGAGFSCQLCGQTMDDQLMFFNHLKEHYEPEVTGKETLTLDVRDSGKNPSEIIPSGASVVAGATDGTKDYPDGSKPKPKLPRVKHTKKLKHERTFKSTEMAHEKVRDQRECIVEDPSERVQKRGSQGTPPAARRC